jgi:hypothetical protein
LVVDVVAENVTEMYGAEVRLKYDPAKLAVQDFDAQQQGVQIEAGNFLPTEKGFVVANQANETEGTIVYALTLLNPAPAVNGTGILARVRFNVLQPGPATIDVEKAKLVAVDLQTIPSEAMPLALGSSETQAEAAGQPAAAIPADQTATANLSSAEPDPATVSGNEFPWWVVAVGVMVLGVITLGAFAIMGGVNKPQKATQSQARRRPAAQPAQAVDQQPESQTRTRPSAFK